MHMWKILMKKSIFVVGMLFSVSFLCACQTGAGKNNIAENQEIYISNVTTLGLEPHLDYEVTGLSPHIMIDVEGYGTGSKKVLFIIGNDLEPVFAILNADSNESVYEGNLTLVSEDYNDRGSLYMGEFTEVYSSGKYRAYQPQVGYSYDFVIKDDIYRAMYKELYRGLQQMDTEDNSENCYRMATLMFAHEIFPNAYINKYYIKNQIENLLLQQDSTSKSVYARLQTPQMLEKSAAKGEKELKASGTESELSLSTTAEFAGVMANYYHDFYEDDTELAMRCLQAATEAYVSMVKYRDNVTTDAWYYAAASLYRATGNETYKNAITEYDALSDRSKTVSELDYRMLADMAYLNTEYRADYTRCEEIMRQYKNRATEVADATSRQSMYVREDMVTADQQEVLTDMMILGTVDYVLSGGEYSSVQENYLHYYFGRNAEVKNHLHDRELAAGTKEDGLYNIQSLSKLIYILGYDDKAE